MGTAIRSSWDRRQRTSPSTWGRPRTKGSTSIRGFRWLSSATGGRWARRSVPWDDVFLQRGYFFAVLPSLPFDRESLIIDPVRLCMAGVGLPANLLVSTWASSVSSYVVIEV